LTVYLITELWYDVEVDVAEEITDAERSRFVSVKCEHLVGKPVYVSYEGSGSFFDKGVTDSIRIAMVKRHKSMVRRRTDSDALIKNGKRYVKKLQQETATWARKHGG